MKKNRCKPNIFSFLLNGTISCDRIVPLVDKERTYELEEKRCGSYIDNCGTNILTIKNGKAKMTDADCPDQLCVHQKAASKNHESIICLPNKVVVEVDGSEESEFDAVAN